jgi:long-chain acyl-CoA synthetase
VRLEDRGALVALVRPEAAKLRERGVTNLRDGIRVILGEKARDLPSWQRLSGFALTDQPMPRTRLGKYRRFLLPALYSEAVAGGARRTTHALTPQDAALLREPTAEAVWTLLRERYPEQPINLDDNLSLDLNVDSFDWMEIAVALDERMGIYLSETDVAGIQTVRDLLRLAIKRRDETGTAPRKRNTATDFAHWLTPTGIFATAFGMALYALNRLVMHGPVPAARNGRRAVARGGGIRDHGQSRQRSRRDGDRCGAAVVAIPAALLGGRCRANVLQPAFSPLLPGGARLPG